MRTTLPVVTTPVPDAEARSPRPPEVDERGDAIFRFTIPRPVTNGDLDLAEYYRRSIFDLLTTVRLFSRGKPVIVDAFAFLDSPDVPIPVLKGDASQGKR